MSIPPGASPAYEVGRMLKLLKEHAPVSAYGLAKLAGENPRRYQRYFQGLEAAGVAVLRNEAGEITAVRF